MEGEGQEESGGGEGNEEEAFWFHGGEGKAGGGGESRGEEAPVSHLGSVAVPPHAKSAAARLAPGPTRAGDFGHACGVGGGRFLRRCMGNLALSALPAYARDQVPRNSRHSEQAALILSIASSMTANCFW